MDSDAELARRAKEGDDAAFGELVKRHIDALYSFLLRYTGDQNVAEDATQDAFVKAWKNMKKFDPDRALTPWLFEIGRNAANDVLRRKRALPFTALSTAEDAAFEESLPDPAPLPPELFETRELGEAVSRALMALPPRDRAILTLRYTETLAWEEIAEVIGAPANTVKSWHRRALLRLREGLAHLAPKRDDGA
jgi:RNA polymerase sigma-70 factor (ECF subfamily)